MKFLFLVGVEGTGHQMVQELLTGHVAKDSFVESGLWRAPMMQRWDSNPQLSMRGILSRMLKPDKAQPKGTFKEQLKREFDVYAEQGVTHLFESMSFPFNHPRDTLRRPDIIELIDAIDDLVEYKFLVLYRNPISSAYSGIRRGFTDNVRLQAKIVEDNLIFIASQLSSINSALYKVLVFEDFLSEANAYVQPLAKWWDLDATLLFSDLKYVNQPTQISEIPREIKIVLDEFFTEARISQWSQFYASNKLFGNE